MHFRCFVFSHRTYLLSWLDISRTTMIYLFNKEWDTIIPPLLNTDSLRVAVNIELELIWDSYRKHLCLYAFLAKNFYYKDVEIFRRNPSALESTWELLQKVLIWSKSNSNIFCQTLSEAFLVFKKLF